MICNIIQYIINSYSFRIFTTALLRSTQSSPFLPSTPKKTTNYTLTTKGLHLELFRRIIIFRWLKNLFSKMRIPMKNKIKIKLHISHCLLQWQIFSSSRFVRIPINMEAAISNIKNSSSKLLTIILRWPKVEWVRLIHCQITKAL